MMHQPPKPGPDPERPVHIVFVGAGAVGCFYASRLHFPNHNIHTSLIARSNYKVLAESGVKLQTHTFGNYTFTPHAVYPSINAASPSSSSSGDKTPPKWDYVIVTTKALPDRSNDAELIAPLITSPETCIVLIQNGVGVEHPYRKRFPSNPIVSAVTVVSAEQISLGVIRQNRWTRIHLGPYSDSASFEIPGAASSSSSPSLGDAGKKKELEEKGLYHANRLGDWWTRHGLIRDVEISSEINLQLIRWHKLCINAAFNPSAVLSGGLGNSAMALDRDPITQTQELRLHLKGVMEEIWNAVPKILGRGFPEDGSLASPEKILRSSERNVGSKPSMLLDWEGGRPMELEVILGNPVRIARGRGVELPRMQTLYALLGSMQRVREQEREKKEKGKL
ncbi:putative 2-dehydropantoate 2-reductase [Naviculisporaceae sp. PSN 640]